MSDRIKNLWAWMRQYRRWEANRKVFLDPENYLEPEPRDDKTARHPDERPVPRD
jgi:hypothetical protein